MTIRFYMDLVDELAKERRSILPTLTEEDIATQSRRFRIQQMIQEMGAKYVEQAKKYRDGTL